VPKHIDPNSELQRVQATLDRDPDHLFRFSIRLSGDAYSRLLEQCVASPLTVSHHLTHLCEQAIQQQGQPSVIDLDATSREIVAGLATLWGVDEPAAIQKLVERVGLKMLVEEGKALERLRHQKAKKVG
jgi:hypothetical protein